VIDAGLIYYLEEFKNMGFLGLRGKDFPTDIAEQNAAAMTLMKVLVLRVLSREEPFTLSVKKVFERKFAKGTGEVLIPPIEVRN